MRYVWMGLAAGVISGMGMGGGSLLIPLLTLLGGLGQMEAQTSNLIAYLPAAAVALWVHHRAGRVRWKQAGGLLLWGALGAALGFGAAALLEESVLRKGFGVFLILLGLWQFFLGEKRGKSGNKETEGA